MYQHVIVHFVMRDCDNHRDAVRKLEHLLPQYPDDNTKYCESWVIVEDNDEE